MGAELKGQVGELRFSIEIKRKATGQVEKYDLIGKVLPEETLEEQQHGCNSQHSSSERSE